MTEHGPNERVILEEKITLENGNMMRPFASTNTRALSLAALRSSRRASSMMR
jgi:hypothetical protein